MKETTQPDASLFIRHAITLCMTARGTVSPYMIQAVVNSAPNTEDDKCSTKWRQTSFCWELLIQAHYKQLHPWAQKDFDDTAAFWLEDFPLIPLAVRLGIVYQINATNDFYGNGERQSDDPDHWRTTRPRPLETSKVLSFAPRGQE
jgi:hypothetical protein